MGTRSILGRRCRASSIRSEEIVQRIVGMFNKKGRSAERQARKINRKAGKEEEQQRRDNGMERSEE
jgi:hypothetical protein